MLENPQIQGWIEEQRRKITEALRSLGEELDPQSRREAEAFAYEGRLPGQREATGFHNAVAIATGRDAEGDAVTRRLHMGSSQSSVDLEERRRLGREYLARRNQLMLDRQQEKPSDSTEGQEVPESFDTEKPHVVEKQSSNNSFDHLLNDDGTLRAARKPLPEPAMTEASTPIGLFAGKLGFGAPSRTDSNEKSFQAGSHYANPFGDEYEMADTQLAEGSTISKPPVPPKIALNEKPTVAAREVQEEPEEGLENLSYEEQLARALSLSLGYTEETTRLERQRTQSDAEDAGLAAAIEASLAEQTHKVETTSAVRQVQEPETDDELYTLSPQHTHAQPAIVGGRYDPVHEAAVSSSNSTPAIFQSLSSLSAEAQSNPASNVDEHVGSRELLVDLNDSPEQTVPATEHSQIEAPGVNTSSTATVSTLPRSMTDSHTTMSDFEADDFSSLPDSEAHSVVESESSLVEVEDIDIDSMSSDDDGIRTPGSWTDVGSQVDDSEQSEDEAEREPVTI